MSRSQTKSQSNEMLVKQDANMRVKKKKKKNLSCATGSVIGSLDALFQQNSGLLLSLVPRGEIAVLCLGFNAENAAIDQGRFGRTSSCRKVLGKIGSSRQNKRSPVKYRNESQLWMNYSRIRLFSGHTHASVIQHDSKISPLLASDAFSPL